MRAAARVLVLGAAVIAWAGCGGGGGGGGSAGPVDLSGLDPSVEGYTGVNNVNLTENGHIARINAAANPVHDGAVSVWFQDVETHEVRFPSDSHPTMIPLVPGATYAFHAWFYASDVIGTQTPNDFQIDLSAAFYLGVVFMSATLPTTVHVSTFGAFEMLSFTFQAPVGIDRCYVSIRATAAPTVNVDLYVDDFSLDRL